ncbi:MAG: hypothetical protein KAY24_13170 [Candidatus Eisenbacteria sp.]|nr:hypothetical protein [Candidatus Eisenbacteria bacterium]
MARAKSSPAKIGQLVSVLTGDLVESTRMTPDQRRRLVGIVDAALSPRRLRRALAGGRVLGRQVFRGDAFQVLLNCPGIGLAAALHIMADLRAREQKLNASIGARIAVGIGAVEYFTGQAVRPGSGRAKRASKDASSGRVGESFHGDGEAFRYSGKSLDQMAKHQFITVCTAWPEVNAELNVGCRFLDGLIVDMSDIQAAALRGVLQGMTQREIAEAEGKSQSAIAQRLRRVNWNAVRVLLDRYAVLVDRPRHRCGSHGGPPA